MNIIRKKGELISVNHCLSINSMLRFLLMVSFLIILTGKELKSQFARDGVLEIVGWIYNDKDEPIRRANVKVYHEEVLIKETRTNRRGKVSLELPIDKSYIAVFSYDDLATKKMSFNTGLPQDFKGFNVFYFEFIVELFPMVEGVNYALLETPFIEISYMNDKKEFFFEETAAKPMLAKVQELKEHTYKVMEFGIEYAQIDNEEEIINEETLTAYSEVHIVEDFIENELVSNNAIIEEEIADEISKITMPDEENIAVATDLQNEQDVQKEVLQELTEQSGKEELATAYEKHEEEDEKDDFDDYFSPDIFVERELPAYNAIEEKLLAYFSFASYNLDDESFSELDKTIYYLRNNPAVNIVISGHTDKRGNNLFNFYLSQLRTHTAYNYCISKGIEPDRILPIAFGQNSPRIKNASKESEHKQNRRIEIDFINSHEFAEVKNNIAQISFRHLNNLNSDANFSQDVEYMVQFIASKVPVGVSYFHKILTEYSETDIIYYYDPEKMHRYLVGSFNSINDATDAAIKLQSMGYGAYVIAFSGKERVSVTEARSIQASIE